MIEFRWMRLKKKNLPETHPDRIKCLLDADIPVGPYFHMVYTVLISGKVAKVDPGHLTMHVDQSNQDPYEC